MKNETKDFYLEAINRALEYIEVNSSKNITLEEIASYSFLSKYHFHRVFKLIIGNTTKDYLTRLHLEKAIFALKTSKKNNRTNRF